MSYFFRSNNGQSVRTIALMAMAVSAVVAPLSAQSITGAIIGGCGSFEIEDKANVSNR
jgi:hypothetical protein